MDFILGTCITYCVITWLITLILHEHLSLAWCNLIPVMNNSLLLTCDYHNYGNPALLSCIIYSDLLSWMELSATRNKVPHHTRWGPPLESVGATSRIHPLRTKCHMEQSATPHTWWGPPLESVGPFPVMTSYSRNLIILTSHKKVNLHGEWGEVMDAGMMPCL